MASGVPVDLEGYLSLEGPLLESVVALHLMSTGCKVVPRRSSYGIHHDVLVEVYDGYAFYECTGQAEITVEKIDKFRNDALRLRERLEKMEGRKLKKCVFVAAVGEDSWSQRSMEAFKEAAERLKREGCEVEFLEGMELLKQLLLSGSLGFRLYLNRVYFAGPEDYAIRFDRESGGFKLMYPRIPLESYRAAPFSSLPSHYWEMYYQSKLVETLKSEYRELLEPIWTYYYYSGLKWKSLQDLVACYREYLPWHPRAYLQEINGEEDWLPRVYETTRGNIY